MRRIVSLVLVSMVVVLVAMPLGVLGKSKYPGGGTYMYFTGIVLDDETRAPLPNLWIMIKYGVTTEYVCTDVYGRYTLVPEFAYLNEPYRMVASFMDDGHWAEERYVYLPTSAQLFYLPRDTVGYMIPHSLYANTPHVTSLSYDEIEGHSFSVYASFGILCGTVTRSVSTDQGSHSAPGKSLQMRIPYMSTSLFKTVGTERVILDQGLYGSPLGFAEWGDFGLQETINPDDVVRKSEITDFYDPGTGPKGTKSIQDSWSVKVGGVTEWFGIPLSAGGSVAFLNSITVSYSVTNPGPTQAQYQIYWEGPTVHIWLFDTR